MNNPWEEIDLNDYESHMSLENVYQLQALNQMMEEQFLACKADSVMILGIAGGNGLEHINKEQFKVVYGVDINKKYLNECQKRYPVLENVFKPICADLSDENLQLPHSDLLIANLLIEYIGYEWFQKVVTKVNPEYISCIIQINTETSFISDSPYLHVFDGLDEVHHQIEEKTVTETMNNIGYAQKSISENALPNGKKLLRIDFVR